MDFFKMKEKNKNERINSILGLVHLGDYQRAIELLILQMTEDAYERGVDNAGKTLSDTIEELEAQLSKKKHKKGTK